MSGQPTAGTLARRALRIMQAAGAPLFMFSLTAGEILQVADISGTRGNDPGRAIGSQRPEIRLHIQEITDYLDSDQPLIPNPIIIALPSDVLFTCSRGPNARDSMAVAGTLKIPLPSGGATKPCRIVDGQQRTLAWAVAKRQDFPVPVNAFMADSVELQRDQFLRINNTRRMSPDLVTAVLPEIGTPLPPRLPLRQVPAALCDLLNSRAESPFHSLIRHPKASRDLRGKMVVTDASLIQALRKSLISPSGCLFRYRDLSNGDIDIAGMWTALMLYWTTVRDTFPLAWGKPPSQSRLMHGAGIRAMSLLMDPIMARIDARQPGAREQVSADLVLLAPYCRWTDGTWEELGLRWDEVQGIPRHIHGLSSFLIRTYLLERARPQ